MSEFIGFDPKKYSDEELLERAVEVSRRLLWAYRMGNNTIVQQLQAQKSAIEIEQRERSFQNVIGNRMLSMSPLVFESDPDLAELQRAEREKEITQNAPKPRNRPRPIAQPANRIRPTSQPTKDDSE